MPHMLHCCGGTASVVLLLQGCSIEQPCPLASSATEKGAHRQRVAGRISIWSNAQSHSGNIGAQKSSWLLWCQPAKLALCRASWGA
jgi:hypothetical protein